MPVSDEIIDFIPSFDEMKKIRALGYMGTSKVDAVLRWLREEKNFHITPIFCLGYYKVKIYFKDEHHSDWREIINTSEYVDFYDAANRGIDRAVFYLNNQAYQANITIKQVQQTN